LAPAFGWRGDTALWFGAFFFLEAAMIFRITFKDPDGVDDSVAEAADKHGVPEEDIREHIRPWVEFSEYVTIEIDTVARTATVLKN
jgi:hypothetical protein